MILFLNILGEVLAAFGILVTGFICGRIYLGNPQDSIPQGVILVVGIFISLAGFALQIAAFKISKKA